MQDSRKNGPGVGSGHGRGEWRGARGVRSPTLNDTNPSPAPVTTRSVLALVFGVLGITATCPCLGSIAAIALGLGEENGVGRAGFHLGWISLVLLLLGGFFAAGLFGITVVGGALVDLVN